MSNLPIIFPEIFKQHQKRAGRVLGIDLGTTNSVVADCRWDFNRNESVDVECLNIAQYTSQGIYRNSLVPSVVAIHQGTVFIGEGAKKLRTEAIDKKLTVRKNLFYECKNEMGVKISYQGPEDFQSPADIAAQVVKFLYDNALAEDPTPVDRVVVTVPASFQVAQRIDTITAATKAGLTINAGDLLDEPVAAFLDYLLNYSEDLLQGTGEPQNVMVFDFGGGTCDVALFRIHLNEDSGAFEISNRSVSRYHQLGGGDLDKQIIHDILMPQLLAENKLEAYDLSFSQKKKTIEPALLGIAEGLKIKISNEIDRIIKFNKYDKAKANEIKVSYPGATRIKIGDKILTLTNPTLNAEQFEERLADFLDQDLLYPRGNEYRTVCSVMAPVVDAVKLSKINREDLDYCLITGGSSLLPHIGETIASYFPNVRMLSFPAKEAYQTTVAVGAAYHALALAVRGSGLVQPVNHELISIRTQTGVIELIPAGVPLPYPPGGQYKFNHEVLMPATTAKGKQLTLRIEIVAGDEGRLLFSQAWDLNGPLKRGEPMGLEYRYDANQVLDIHLSATNRLDNDQIKSFSLDKPLTNVVNPNQTRQRILELNEEMRTKQLKADKRLPTYMEIAKLHSELKEYERAIELMKAAQAGKARPDATILNYIGIYYGELGDWERQEKFYREASTASEWGGPMFNLALSMRKRKEYTDAMECVEQALAKEEDGAYWVLKAMLAKDLGDHETAEACLQDAMNCFPPVEEQSEWQLTWYIAGAKLLGDKEKEEKARAAQQGRPANNQSGGILPIMDDRGR